ncbi:MAG TPA: hypothetical protein VKW08_10880 [Xanthobacteraceae bacterium]|nr:hypothetical protein [Xanthobacteraceae bacterium]
MSNQKPSGLGGLGNGAEAPIEHLRHAEQDLEKALEQEQEARQEVEKAEAEVAEAIREVEHPHQFTVEIFYDGVGKKFEVRAEETVKTLLDKAIAAFGPLTNPHMLSLYKGGNELADAQTLKEAGVKPHDVLLLRPSKVKGGA